MQSILLLWVAFAVVTSLSSGERIGSRAAAGPIQLSSIRGGGKSKLGSSKVRATRIDDDDDDDEVEGTSRRKKNSFSGSRKVEIEKRRPSKRKPSKASSGIYSLIPWSQNESRGRRGRKSRSMINWKASLEKLAKHGQAAYKDLYRKAKVLKSSAFESILLKATWPGDDPVPPELLSEIIKYSIPSFKYARADTEDDPYYMTLHKLWTKMCEQDWRTVAKSLYIMHCISRDSSVDTCKQFASAMKDLTKTRNPKKPDHKYFELRRVAQEFDANSVAFEELVVAYAQFVFQRAKSFSAKFEELRDLEMSMKNLSAPSPALEKKVVAQLKKANVLVKSILEVDVSSSQSNIIIGQAVKLLATDLKDLWTLYHSLLQPWLSSARSPTDAGIREALTFFRDNDAAVNSWLQRHTKTLSSLRVKLPKLAPISPETSVQLETVLKISGGFAKKKRTPVEDIDEEEEEEENEDDEDDDEEGDDDEVEEEEPEDADDDEADEEDDRTSDDDDVEDSEVDPEEEDMVAQANDEEIAAEDEDEDRDGVEEERHPADPMEEEDEEEVEESDDDDAVDPEDGDDYGEDEDDEGDDEEDDE